MSGFEPAFPGVGSDHSANYYATFTDLLTCYDNNLDSIRSRRQANL